MWNFSGLLEAGKAGKACSVFRVMIRPKLALCLVVVVSFLCAAAFGAQIAPVPPGAVGRVAAVQVRVAPDHPDWTYKLGEVARFRITVTADNTPLENVTVSYTVGQEMMAAEKKTAQVSAEGVLVEGGTLKEPGFLRCTATVEVAGRTAKGVATAAFSPEKIVPTQTEPADFDAFWQAGKDELAKLPVEPRLTLLPDACTDKVNVYHVSFRTVGPNWTTAPSRIFGILCEPKAPGRYPAILKVPGAGIRPYSGDKGLAARGAIVLEIGIHGVPVNMAQEVYDALFAGPLCYYWTFNLDNKDTFYYRRVYLGCLRANDFLMGRENWDGKNLLVMGASQGGQLSIVTAALDPRVTGLSATHPAFCDVTGDLNGRAGGWPRPFQPDPGSGMPSVHATPAKIETTSYYDTVNFARRLKAPGYYIWGYNDDVCPPTSVYAAYNQIKAPKELGLMLEQAHTYPPELWEAVNAWVVKHLGLK